MKCVHRQEFVIVGYTDPAGSRTGFGALLLGVRDSRRGTIALCGQGRHGIRRARTCARSRNGSRRSRRARRHRNRHPRAASARACTGWTPSSSPRSRSASGRPTGACAIRCSMGCARTSRRARSSPSVPRTRSPGQRERVSGAPHALAGRALKARARGPLAPAPFGRRLRPSSSRIRTKCCSRIPASRNSSLRATGRRSRSTRCRPWSDRPLTLLRCPEGYGAQCFYQKHVGVGVPAAVARITINEDEEPYAMVDGRPALLGLVQIGALELHVWGSRAEHLDQPDIIVFDLDPAEDVGWRRRRRRRFLAQRTARGAWGFLRFARLTGGKGLHVVVPVVPGPDWPAVKRFARAVVNEMRARRSEAFHGVDGEGQARRQDLHRLPAQRPRSDRDRFVLAASARGRTGRVADRVGRARSTREGAAALRLARRAFARAPSERDPWADFEAARRSLGPGSTLRSARPAARGRARVRRRALALFEHAHDVDRPRRILPRPSRARLLLDLDDVAVLGSLLSASASSASVCSSCSAPRRCRPFRASREQARVFGRRHADFGARGRPIESGVRSSSRKRIVPHAAIPPRRKSRQDIPCRASRTSRCPRAPTFHRAASKRYALSCRRRVKHVGPLEQFRRDLVAAHEPREVDVARLARRKRSRAPRR